MPDPVIGHRLFADGVSRPVRLDAAGQQDVVGPDGEPVPGVWVLPAEVPSVRARRWLCRCWRGRRPEGQTGGEG